MNNLEFGLVTTLVGMGGTVLVMGALVLLIFLLTKIFPKK